MAFTLDGALGELSKHMVIDYFDILSSDEFMAFFYSRLSTDFQQKLNLLLANLGASNIKVDEITKDIYNTIYNKFQNFNKYIKNIKNNNYNFDMVSLSKSKNDDDKLFVSLYRNVEPNFYDINNEFTKGVYILISDLLQKGGISVVDDVKDPKKEISKEDLFRYIVSFLSARKMNYRDEIKFGKKIIGQILREIDASYGTNISSSISLGNLDLRDLKEDLENVREYYRNTTRNLNNVVNEYVNEIIDRKLLQPIYDKINNAEKDNAKAAVIKESIYRLLYEFTKDVVLSYMRDDSVKIVTQNNRIGDRLYKEYYINSK